jgi:hypothetical protein
MAPIVAEALIQQLKLQRVFEEPSVTLWRLVAREQLLGMLVKAARPLLVFRGQR